MKAILSVLIVLMLFLMMFASCMEEVIVPGKDVHDTTLIIQADTVVDREIIYEDTAFISWGFNTNYIPDELKPMVAEFYKECTKRKLPSTGYELLVQIDDIDEIEQAYSFFFYAQWVIVINGNQTTDEMFLPLWRELARIELKKEYSLDEDNLMWEYYPSNKIRWSNRDKFTKELDQIFN